MKPKVFILFFVTVLIGIPVHADQFFVQSAKAPIWAEPAFQSNRIGELLKGDTVEKISEQGGWLKIVRGQQQGWMLKLMLSSQPPMDAINNRQQVVDELAMRARRRPSSYATTAAARGLREKRNQIGTKLNLNYQALEKMESWRVEDKDALNFLMKVQRDE